MYLLHIYKKNIGFQSNNRRRSHRPLAVVYMPELKLFLNRNYQNGHQEPGIVTETEFASSSSVETANV